MNKQDQKRMRSLENKIAYRTEQIANMIKTADDASVRMLDKANTDAKREHAEQLHKQRLANIEKTRKSWLEPLQVELADLTQKLLDE